jgi:hypothetical protein
MSWYRILMEVFKLCHEFLITFPSHFIFDVSLIAIISFLMCNNSFFYLFYLFTLIQNSTEVSSFVIYKLRLLTHVFLPSPLCYQMIRRGSHLTSFPTNNKHIYPVVNRLLYIVYFISYIHIKILQVLRAQRRYNETKVCDLVLHNWTPCNMTALDNSFI